MSYDKSQFYGIDPDQSRQSAQQMDASADNLSGMVGMIGALMSQVVWEGADAERFHADWQGSFQPQLNQATETIRANAVELNRRAAMQEEVSR